jgi:hypothetical protein
LRHASSPADACGRSHQARTPRGPETLSSRLTYSLPQRVNPTLQHSRWAQPVEAPAEGPMAKRRPA